MSRPRAYLPPEGWTLTGPGDQVTLSGETHHHLRRVLRVRPGDDVILFDGAGREADIRLVTVEDTRLLAEVADLRTRPTLPGPPVTLLVATLKADKLEWVAQKCTELGVDRFWPVETARSVPRPKPAAAQRRHDRLVRITREACRQCGRAWLPEVRPAAPLGAALEEGAGGHGLVLWEAAEAEHGLRSRLQSQADPAPLTLLVGPEGGLCGEEVERVERGGFLRASLGTSILRAETAAVAAVTLACAHLGRLG